MKKYGVWVRMGAGFLYEITAKDTETAEAEALEKARTEYEENGLDYPEFNIEDIKEIA
jgi:hypothetical protein